MKKLFFIFFLCACSFGVSAQTYWELQGNRPVTSRDFLGTLECSNLDFRTRNTDRMRLMSDKSFLGIGLLNPLATLHLHYQIDREPCDISNHSSSVKKLLQLTTSETGSLDTNGFSIFYDAKDITFKQQEQANFFIEGPGGGFMIAPDGKIGLGTEQPQEKLHIHDENIILTKTFPNSSVNPKGSIRFHNDVAPTYSSTWGISYLNENGSAGLNFWNGNSLHIGCNSVFFLSDGGKVGIGITDPLAKLDVNGSFKAQSANITDSITTNTLKVQNAEISSLSINELIFQNFNFTGNTYFDGNVGIGTDQPKQKLHVENGNLLMKRSIPKVPGVPNGSIIFDSSSGNSGSINDTWGIEYVNSQSEGYGLNFWNYKDKGFDEKGYQMYSRLFISDNSGCVGIGTKTPTKTLDVDGTFGAESADISGTLKAQNANITGTISTNALSAQSANITDSITAQNAKSPKCKYKWLGLC